jgi:hypothetical protein
MFPMTQVQGHRRAIAGVEIGLTESDSTAGPVPVVRIPISYQVLVPADGWQLPISPGSSDAIRTGQATDWQRVDRWASDFRCGYCEVGNETAISL